MREEIFITCMFDLKDERWGIFVEMWWILITSMFDLQGEWRDFKINSSLKKETIMKCYYKLTTKKEEFH